MNRFKTQYFLAYAVMGSLGPFLPIYLQLEQGLGEDEIGLVLGVSSVSILLTPVLMTLLADTRFDPRQLTAYVFAISGLSLLGLFFAHGFWIVLFLLCLHSLAYAGVMPLQDGMTFSVQRERERHSKPTTPYHRIRVWGTVDFILPSLILFALFNGGWSTGVILFCGLGFSLLALANALRLPDPRFDGVPADAAAKLPTTLALRLLLQPHMRVFCAALFLFFLGFFSFASFYPLYLLKIVNVQEQWIGLIYNFGVVIEIGFLLGLGWFQTRFGVRKLMIMGILCFIGQMAALGLFPNVWVALAAQSVHGMIILTVFIAPIMYLNRQAGDRFRNSIQGLYTMAIVGVSRITGIVAAGQVAEVNLRLLPFIALGTAVVALSLFVFVFRDSEPLVPEEAG